MKYSYHEFLKALRLIDTELSKTIYQLYLDSFDKPVEAV